MGSIVGRESEEIARLEATIAAVLENPDPDDRAGDIAEVLRGLYAEIEAAKQRYWQRAGELHRVRAALKLSG